MPYAFANGTGTEADPYQVWTADDFNGIRDYALEEAYFKQMADIDLSEYADWEPIGKDLYDEMTQTTSRYIFNGHYKGQSHSVSRMAITQGAMAEVFSGFYMLLTGLFGYVRGSLDGINLVDYDINLVSAAYARVNTLAIGNSGTITMCSAQGVIDASAVTSAFISGLTASEGQIENCFSKFSFNASSSDDIISGISYQGSAGLQHIFNCYTIAIPMEENAGIFIGVAPAEEDMANINYYNSDFVAIDPDYSTGYGVPKTTAEMKQQSTYVGWDFTDTWGIDPAKNDGYPYLRVFSQAEPEEEPIIDDVIPSYPPASYIKLQFQAGDSELYDMGIFYTDKTRYRVGDPGAKVNARNSVGKYLRDQTYDERNNFSVMRLDDLLEKILIGAGITDYYVATNATQLGMQFPPNKSILDGIEEILAYAPGWVIREEVTGRVVIGPKDDPEFTQPSRYTFQRDRDIFSREQIKDDQLIYGRVCVHVADFSIKVYRAVTSALGWLPPAQKTYYQSVPDGTTSQEAAALATELADAMADSGEVETFVCPFRPQIIPGDEAEILDSDGATFLGVITQVKHDFGAGGFYTTITVDSGGRIGRPRFKDLVNAINSVTTISHKL